MNKFEHLILKPICFKGLFLSTIELTLNNHKHSLMKLDMYKTGISYHSTK